MVINAIIILLSILNVIAIILFFVLLFNGVIDFVIIPIILTFICFLLIIYLILITLRKYPKNNVEEFCSFDLKKATEKNGNRNTITFYNENGIWVCKKNSVSLIKLDLRGFLFPKSYIRAFVVRNCRYRNISNKRPMYLLFKMKYKHGFSEDLYIKFVKDKEKYVKVIKNGVSVNSLLSKAITQLEYEAIYNRDKFIFTKTNLNEKNLFNQKKIRRHNRNEK